MSEQSPPAMDAARDFLAEAEEVVEALSSRLGELSDMAEKGAWDPDLLNAIFRDAHSLKGLAGMFGFAVVSEVAHHTENLLDWLRMGKLSLTRPVLEILFNSAELLATLLRSTLDGTLEQHREAVEAHARAIAACMTSAGSTSAALPCRNSGCPPS